MFIALKDPAFLSYPKVLFFHLSYSLIDESELVAQSKWSLGSLEVLAEKGILLSHIIMITAFSKNQCGTLCFLHIIQYMHM